jgi:hypothetical protein
MRIRVGTVSGTELQIRTYGLPIANTAFGGRAEGEFQAVSTGSQTFVGTCHRLPAGAGTLTSTGSGTAPTFLRVELL